jgi:hypothetical protein
MLAQAPPYHGRISETLARYAVIQSSQGLAAAVVSPSLHPPAQSHTQPTPSRYTWYPKHGLARSPVPFGRPAGPIITLSGCRRGALDLFFFLLLPSA